MLEITQIYNNTQMKNYYYNITGSVTQILQCNNFIDDMEKCHQDLDILKIIRITNKIDLDIFYFTMFLLVKMFCDKLNY